MEQKRILEAVERIRQMEHCFDALQETEETEDVVFRMRLEHLIRYYESGLWLADYTLDEKGLLPETLKRGVLSQDAVYDFLQKRA